MLLPCIALALVQTTSAPALDMHRTGEVDRYLQTLTGYGYSGTVLVVKDGKAVLDKGYGLADREAGVPCAPNTVYEIGSLAKQFTATAIMKLEAQGKLKLSDTLDKFFPNLPEDKRGLTIELLLTHSSGLHPVSSPYPPEDVK